MIVEPVPTNPRSPIRRLLRVLGLTAPVLLLVAVVAVGALGPPPAAPASDAPATPGTAGPTRPPALFVDGEAVSFPETWIGLRVRGIADTRAEQAAGHAQGVIAVAGYLDYGSRSWTCNDEYLDVESSACDGRATLSDLPSSGSPHLHPDFAPRTRAPAADDVPGSPRHEPIPVVMLGRFPDPADAACAAHVRDCDEAFEVERVVWVAGTPWGPILTVDPALKVDPNVPEIGRTVAAAEDALGPGALALAASVVRPDLLAVVDPVAGAALPEIPLEHRLRPVTYLRALVFRAEASQPLYGRDPTIGWVVLDSITGELLAGGGA